MNVISEAFVDFLGTHALAYKQSHQHSYLNDICAYAIYIKDKSNNTTTDLDKAKNAFLRNFQNVRLGSEGQTNWLTLLDDTEYSIEFAKTTDAQYLCYRFKQPLISTDSLTESDSPLSYEELFNTPVSENMTNTTSNMQYSWMWEVCQNFPPVSAANGDILIDSNYMTQRFFLSNKATANTKNNLFSREDYNKFFVNETMIVHDRSAMTFEDIAMSVGNLTHDRFNAILFVVNPVFEDIVDSADGYPRGMQSITYAVPLMCRIFDTDAILAGNNAVFEPNLNGIVTLE